MKRILTLLCVWLTLCAPSWAADLTVIVDTALSEVPVNKVPMVDDTDFRSIEGAVPYNPSGLALRWHFVTTAGAYTVTSVTPTDTGGNYDWVDQGDSGVYTIEIPASGGAEINNETEGVGWFTGVATGVLPWTGPTIQFSPANIANSLVNGSDKLEIDVAQNAGTNITATSGIQAVNATQIGGQTASASGTVTFPNATLASTASLREKAGAVTVLIASVTDANSFSVTITGSAVSGAYDSWIAIVRDVSDTSSPCYAEQRTVAVSSDGFGSSYHLTLDSDLSFTPAAGDIVELYPPSHASYHSGTVVDATLNTLTLETTASATDNFYKSQVLEIIGGAGIGQSRLITNYDGDTNVATIYPNWADYPNIQSRYVVRPGSAATLADGTIAAATFASGAIDASAIAANAIAESEIADGAINAGALASDTITASKFDRSTAFPLASEDNGDTKILRKGSGLVTGTSIEGKVETVDTVVDGIASAVATLDGIVDNIFTAFEVDGGVYRLTTNALEQLATDWSATEKNQIRHRLGLDGTTSTPSATPSLGTVNANVTSMANNVMTASAADNSLGTELATETWEIDGRTLSGTTNDFDELLDGAPTFADAMDDHGYTTERAEKVDRLAPSLLLSTTVEVAASQTSLVLDEGPTEDDVFNGSLVIITDASEPAVKAVALVKDYEGDTKTITLLTDPEIFTIAAEDSVDIIAAGSPAALWLGSSP